MNRYSIQLSRQSRRVLAAGPPEGLPLTAAASILAFIETELRVHPTRVGKPLRSQLIGHYGARRGPYRLIYTIDEDELTIRIVRIDHRAYVYRTQ